MYKKPSKLGSDKSYKKPKKTYQEQLTADEIREKLRGYIKVEDIAEVPLSTHIRYFDNDKHGRRVFRTGGQLFNKNQPDVYVMLSNGDHTWSVQVVNAIFYRKMNHQEQLDNIHQEYDTKIEELEATIRRLRRRLKASQKIEK